MARPNKLKELETTADFEGLLVKTVNNHGQVEAAKQLKVSQSSISRWLKEQGYTQVVQYVKREKVKAS